MKHIFSHDSIPRTPPEGVQYVTSEDAARVMLDAQDGAADARRRMLERQQGHSKSESAAAVRLRMLQREKR